VTDRLILSAVAETADGCRLAYETVGTGPCVVLVAGLGGLGAFWSQVRTYLAEGHSVLTFDHRGCGRSDRPVEEYSVEKMASDVIAILDHAGIGEADVVGHSTGGAIAQVLALDAPGRVRRIVASGSWARPDTRFKAMFRNRIDMLRDVGPVAYTLQSQLLGYPPDWFNAHAAELEQALWAAEEALAPTAVAIARLRMLLAFDRAAELARLSLPVLVMGAPDDMLIPIGLTREMWRLIRQASYEEMHGGHFFPRVDPERYAGYVTSFLDRRP
jgi:aminoacrylate hydrolase